MKTILNPILSILFLVHFIFSVCCLFHIGGKNLVSVTYDKLAAFSFIISCFYFICFLKTSNKN